MTGVIAREILRIDKLNRYKHDECPRHIVGRIRDLVRRTEVRIVEVQDQFELIVVQVAELVESLFDFLHRVVIVRVLRVHSHLA